MGRVRRLIAAASSTGAAPTPGDCNVVSGVGAEALEVVSPLVVVVSGSAVTVVSGTRAAVAVSALGRAGVVSGLDASTAAVSGWEVPVVSAAAGLFVSRAGVGT